MAGTGQGLLFGMVLLGAGAAISMAVAETIPLPTPAPLPKEGVPPKQSAQSGGGFLDSLKKLFDPEKQPTPPAATAPPAATSFNATQRAQVDKISAYLTNVQQLAGNFVQVGPDGSRVKGEFYIQKPGKVRFEYEPPYPIEIIADGQAVVVRNSKLATQDLYPLSQTPLRFLLTERIDLLKETNVISVRADEMFVTIVIEEKHAVVGTSRLLVMVGAKDYQLKQWTVTDPQGYDTTVAVSNLDTTKRPDPGLFKIDYTRYQ
ncbi:MAG TPA: outer membrane lipoprotein carrier protein LolA [Xanthobacteraceae bacterium]|nr:outer membrane lipoprotein carrier protein LolA [Xanthobacteraceae bacterium]